MKKLNNKGITIVELVLCFTIITMVAIGMFQVVISLKNDAYYKTIINKVSEFKTNLLITIENDLILKGYESMEDCSTSTIKCLNLKFANQSIKQLKVDLNNNTIFYAGIKYNMPNEEALNFIKEEVLLKEQDTNLVIKIPYQYKNKKIKENPTIQIIHPISFKYQTGLYKITVNSENGGLLIPKSSNATTKVNFTVHPKEGYYYDGAIISYQGKELETLNKEDKQFIMPTSNITITPIFKKR